MISTFRNLIPALDQLDQSQGRMATEDKDSLADMSFETCMSVSPCSKGRGSAKKATKRRKSVKSALKARRKSFRKSLYAPTSSSTCKLREKAAAPVASMKSTLSSSSSLCIKSKKEATLKPSLTQKKLTIPIAPISHVAKRRGKRLNCLLHYSFANIRTNIRTNTHTFVHTHLTYVPQESTVRPSLKSKSLDETKLTSCRKAKVTVSTKPAATKRRLTIMMPFKMAVSKRAKDTSSIKDGKTAGEIAQKFLLNTRSTAPKESTKSTAPKRPTMPKGPNLSKTTAHKPKPQSYIEKLGIVYTL